MSSPPQGPRPEAGSPLRVSVIIPVLNGGAHLRHCLAAIAACRPQPMEVIVVDDGSTDDSVPWARAFGARVVTADWPAAGPAHARNRGARAAAGDVLLFVDADVALHADAVGRVLAHFAADPGLAACFGSYDDDPAAPGFLSQFKNLCHHFVHQSARRDASTFWTGCGAIRRAVFLAAGGFDERYVRPAIEDIELGYRLKAAGCRLRLDPALQGRHLKAWTLVSLLRSDLFDRGVPWTELILRGGAFVNDLNLQTRNRISVLMAYGLTLALAAGCVWPSAWLAGLLCATALCMCNRQLYGFLAARRGLWFALRSIPVHWLYYLCNGVSFGLGLARHIGRRAAGRHARPLRAEVE